MEVESTDNTLTYFCTSGLKEGPGMYWGKGGSDISSKMGKETNVTIHAFTTRKGVRNMSLDVEFNQYPNTKYYEEYKALEDNKPKNIDLKHGNIAKSVIDISKSIATEVAMDFKGIAIQSNPYKESKTYKFEVEDTTENGGNITCVITEGGKRVYKDNRGEKDKRKVVDRHKVLKFVDGKEVKAYEDILQG